MKPSTLRTTLRDHGTAGWSLAEAIGLLELWELSEAWRSAKCDRQWEGAPISARCVGENHIETCPVEIARQDVTACLNRMEQL